MCDCFLNQLVAVKLYCVSVLVVNTPFVMKIGGTTYEVSTHFSTKGKETVLQQFKDLLIELDLV